MKQSIYSMLLLILMSVTSMTAQVTIGSQIRPEAGALLQLRQEIANVDAGNLTNASKGLLFPRVALVAYDSLLPLYEATVYAADGVTILSGLTPQDQLRATGMVVFNTNPDAAGLELGLYVWIQDEWIALSAKQPDVAFSPVRCEDITINGIYQQGVSVEDADHYMLVTLLNVDRPGAYVVRATTGNGYSFYLSGAVLDKGPTTLKLPAQGTPRLAKEDDVIIQGLPIDGACAYKITVAEGVLTLTADAEPISGSYQAGVDITGHTVRLIVNASRNVASATIASIAETGGVTASWRGALTRGVNVVSLQLSGAPTASTPFDLPVLISAENTTFPAFNRPYSLQIRIPITIPTVTYGIIQNDNHYSWGRAARYDALSSVQNFSASGKVKVVHNAFWGKSGISASAATSRLQTEKTKYNKNPAATLNLPDYILWFAYKNNSNTLSDLLAWYIERGGVVVYAPDDYEDAHADHFLKAVFPSSGISAHEIAGSGNSQPFTIASSSDPVIRGPFENLAGKYWVDHNQGTVAVTLPATGFVNLVSGGASPNHSAETGSVVWYSTTKNFFYFGDSTGAATRSTQGGSGDDPAHFGNASLKCVPLYGTTNNNIAHNAYLEMNAVAWAINRALNGGINHPLVP
jgi:hypothetical protein